MEIFRLKDAKNQVQIDRGTGLFDAHHITVWGTYSNITMIKKVCIIPH